MKLSVRQLVVTLVACFLALASVHAADPKPGRYKGTMTLRTVVEGTNAEVKKIIPVAGIYFPDGRLQMVIPDVPSIGPYFTSQTFNARILNGDVTMYPNSNATPFSLFSVKLAAGSIKGSVDFGLITSPTGGGDARRFFALALTRVGN